MNQVAGAPFNGTFAKDSGSIDAFGRWRVSNPETIFDSKQIFDNQPLFWDDSEVSGSGTTSTHSTDEARTRLGVSATTAGKRVRQTFMRFNYQPGKSAQVIMTAVISSASNSGIKAAVGQFDDNNGLFFKLDEGTLKVVRRTSATGSVVDNEVTQANFNLDTMDGNGESGVTIDPAKTQILFIDYEWLGVGRVRMGFVIDGIPIYCHEFNNANSLSTVYMSTPNLPLRYEIENDGTGAATTMDHICATVISEGGAQELGVLRSDGTHEAEVDANVSGTFYALIGIRLKSAALGATVLLEKMTSVLDTNDIAYWELRLNPTVAGTFTYSDQTNSVVQTAIGNTSTNPSPNTVTGGAIIDSGYISSQGREANIPLSNAIRLGSAIDGTRDEIVLCATPFTGDANLDIGGGITWRELQ